MMRLQSLSVLAFWLTVHALGKVVSYSDQYPVVGTLANGCPDYATYAASPQ
jgi:hypothetical protein